MHCLVSVGLSHCRHMSKIRANVSHLVGTATLGSRTHSATTSRLSREDWEGFIHMEGRVSQEGEGRGEGALSLHR